MAHISFYLDEHVQLALAEAMRARKIDVLTTQEAENIGLSDMQQLVFATKNKRSLFSYNIGHFAKIHYQWMNIRRLHGGIILSNQMTIGPVLRRLMRLYFSLNSEDIQNRLEYLSAWK